MFRRSVMLTALASAMVVVLVAPAEAAPRPLVVDAPFHATGTFDNLGCQLFHQTVDGVILSSARGPLGFHLDFCAFDAPDGVHFPTTGTFALTLGKKKVVTGSLDGNVEALNHTPQGFPLHFRLTITGGTSSYRHATGSLALEGFFSFGAVTADGNATGSISK